jgi:hypothetical protein
MWQATDPKEPLEKGARYRSTYYFKFPYSVTVRNLIQSSIATARPVLRLGGVNLLSTLVYSPELTEQTAGGRYTRWKMVCEWEAV